MMAKSDVFFLKPTSFFNVDKFFSYCRNGKSDIPLFDFINGKQDEIKNEIEKTLPESLDPSRTNIDKIRGVLKSGLDASQRAIGQYEKDAKNHMDIYYDEITMNDQECQKLKGFTRSCSGRALCVNYGTFK
jgi:hypothetical protein